MTLIMPKLSDDEKVQIKNVISMLPKQREVYIADIVGNESFGDVPLAILAQRSYLIKVHTVSAEPQVINWTRSAIKNIGLNRCWTGIQRDPRDTGFRVSALFINGLSVHYALATLKSWVPFMLTDAPVWVHDADEAAESYPHIRKIGRVGRGLACLVTE